MQELNHCRKDSDMAVTPPLPHSQSVTPFLLFFFSLFKRRPPGGTTLSLFNTYMDDLSHQLGACRTGCVIGNTVLNHLMYADDLANFSPSSAGLQQLLNICSEYGINHGILYNARKSMVMLCHTKEDRDLTFPNFYLTGQMLNICTKTKIPRPFHHRSINWWRGY